MGLTAFCSFGVVSVAMLTYVIAQPVCYTFLRPDLFNQNVDCWTDRKTAAVNCSLPEYRCVHHLVSSTPDFVTLRRHCQPAEAIYNPCLFINGASLQVAGVQNYTVNDEPEECLCFDVCDAVSHAALFGFPDLPVDQQSEVSPDTPTGVNSSSQTPGWSTTEFRQNSLTNDTLTSCGNLTRLMPLFFFLSYSVLLFAVSSLLVAV